MTELMRHGSEWIKPSAGLPIVQWAFLLALAAAAGHLVQSRLNLPRVFGYLGIGTLAGLSGYTMITWPLTGISLFMIELALSVVLFEIGSRLSLRWLRHNPMLLVQSLGEATLTYLATRWALSALGVDPALHLPLALVLIGTAPAVLMRVSSDLRANGPVTDRAVTLTALNTFYVLAVGGVMARLLGPTPSVLHDMVYPVLQLLVVSVLSGALLALGLRKAFALMGTASENTVVVQLSWLAAGTTLAAHFGGSPPLAALLAGVLLKALYPRPWTWPHPFGLASTMLSILMFVLVSAAAAQMAWNWQAWALIVWLVLARALTRFGAIGLGGIVSGASLRQSLWTGATLWPVSAVALLLVSQMVQYAPEIGQPVAAIALPLILLLEVSGAWLTWLALRRAKEADPVHTPPRDRPDPEEEPPHVT